MRSACIAFVAGAWWLQQQPDLPDRSIAIVAAVAGLVLAVAATRRFETRGGSDTGTDGRYPAEIVSADDGGPDDRDGDAADAGAETDYRGAEYRSADNRGADYRGADHRKTDHPGANAHRTSADVTAGSVRGALIRLDAAPIRRPGADEEPIGSRDAGARLCAEPSAGAPRPEARPASTMWRRVRPAFSATLHHGRRSPRARKSAGNSAGNSASGSASGSASTSTRRSTAAPRAALRVLVVAGAAACGFGWSSWRADLRIADALPAALEGRDIVIVGVVAALPDRDAASVRFPFAVESVVSRGVDGRPLAVPSRIALGWYLPRRGAGTPTPGVLPNVRPGQRWRLTVRLKRPHGTANPWGFDYEYWLLEQNLRATGSVRPGTDDGATDGDDAETAVMTATAELDDFVWRVDYAVERFRAALRDRVLKALSADGPSSAAAPYAGVLVALIIGDQRAIAQSDWTVFNRTGIGHLVSISGLHVSMLAALGARLVFLAWRRHPSWCGRLPAHQAAALAGVLVALLYCLLAGFGVPAQRTLYMIAVVALALWTHRMASVSRVLCAALVVVVVLDPWSVLGSGFWLSFTAVAAIFYVTTGRLERVARHASWKVRLPHALRGAARLQWAVTLALTPLTLLFFYQVSLVSPLANAIAIPLVSFVVTPLALAGAVLPSVLGTPLLHVAHALVALLAVLLQWLSATPIAVWTGAAPGPVAFACAMVGVAWWLAPRGLPERWTGALWLVPVFAWPVDRPAPGDVRFVALDIGQGTAVVVQTRSADLLYDTGPSFGAGAAANNDAGSRTIVPFLRATGVAKLDTLVVSHNDNDHSGGALSVLAALPVREVRSSLAFETPIVRASPRHTRCVAGQSWRVDDVRFDLLSPSDDVYSAREGAANAKPNARSCVLRVESRGRVMLLTADIEKQQEAALVERAPAAIASDAMLVPHHGSRTSSTDAFLDATHPAIAIVQAGYLNRFGHPRPDVLARYAARGIAVLRNDRDGAITVTLRDGHIDVARYREMHRRYWYPS